MNFLQSGGLFMKNRFIFFVFNVLIFNFAAGMFIESHAIEGDDLSSLFNKLYLKKEDVFFLRILLLDLKKIVMLESVLLVKKFWMMK